MCKRCLTLPLLILSCALSVFCNAQMGAPKLERAVAPSEILAAVLAVLAAWLLLPFLKKSCGAISNGWKLRNLPGPRAGLSGVASVLKVCDAPEAFRRFAALVALGRGQAVCPMVLHC